MSFRVRPELKHRMDQAAAESGRSVSQEVETRLEKSLIGLPEAFGGRVAYGLALLFAATFRHTAEQHARIDGNEWSLDECLRDGDAFEAGLAAAIRSLWLQHPQGADFVEFLREMLDREVCLRAGGFPAAAEPAADKAAA